MPLLAASNVRHAYGTDVVLDGVSITIEPGDRVGIVGRNGTGKSTLLRILAGQITPDAGDVVLQRGRGAGYMSQEPDLDPGDTLRQAAERAFEGLRDLHAELDTIFDQMADPPDGDLERLLARQADLERRIETAGGYAVDHRIDAVLHGLGFEDHQFHLPVPALSGGQRGRLSLARVLLEQPSVLLLDEPTNHLDIAGRTWLEEFLRDEFKGAVLLISHDRYLLDRVVHRIAEVEQGRLIDYPGNYAAFRKLRAERRIAMHRAYERQQDEFKREEAFIRKYKAGQRAKQAQGRLSRLERAKAESTLERPAELATLRLQLPQAERTSDVVASARGISKAYPGDNGEEKVLFRDLDISIGRGERWAIIGPNGAGKTTLVRCLLGELAPDAGAVRLGTRLAVGYFRQTHDHLDPDQPVHRYLQSIVRRECPDKPLSEQAARDLAGAFLFSGDDQDKPMGVLSGGERTRAVLAGLFASAKNVLVLDEPTNHLDIPSAERLEEVLAMPGDGRDAGAFDGTLLLISHDRALIDATCGNLIVLDGHGGAEVFYGNYTDWHDRQVRRAEAATKRETRPARQPVAPTKPEPKAEGGSRYSWMPLEKIEARIGEIESRIGEIDRELDDPDVWKDVDRAGALTDERDRLRDELDPLENEWLRKST